MHIQSICKQQHATPQSNYMPSEFIGKMEIPNIAFFGLDYEHTVSDIIYMMVS